MPHTAIMSSAPKNDGGPAFPEPFALGPNDDLYPSIPGMTLRQWYAGQALAGFLASGGYLSLARSFGGESAEKTDAVVNRSIAEGMFALADAMIAEGSKP